MQLDAFHALRCPSACTDDFMPACVAPPANICEHDRTPSCRPPACMHTMQCTRPNAPCMRTSSPCMHPPPCRSMWHRVLRPAPQCRGMSSSALAEAGAGGRHPPQLYQAHLAQQHMAARCVHLHSLLHLAALWQQLALPHLAALLESSVEQANVRTYGQQPVYRMGPKM